MNSMRLKMLEQKVEDLRMTLHQAVDGQPSRLSHVVVLPISRELDELIIRYHEEKNKRKQ